MKRYVFALTIIVLIVAGIVFAGGFYYFRASHEIISKHIPSEDESANFASASSSASPVERVFFDSNVCRVEIRTTRINPSVTSAATATILIYCGSPATGTFYGTVNNANYLSYGEVVNGDLYITKASDPTATVVYGQPTVLWRQNQVWLYRGSAPVRLVYSLARNDTSSISSLSVSPDESTVAIVKDNDDLDVISSDGVLLRSFPDMAPGSIPVGWGRAALWIDDGSLDGPAYARISLTDWSTEEYYPTEGNSSDDESLNYDTGELAISNFPWFGDPDSYSQFINDSTATVSLFIDNLITGATETIATEQVAVLRGGFQPQWLDDHTLQYNVSATTTATTSLQ